MADLGGIVGRLYREWEGLSEKSPFIGSAPPAKKYVRMVKKEIWYL